MSEPTTVTHASESGHWYQPDGTQVALVPGSKKGSMVTPDIRHARKLGLLPGVTTIIRCAASPSLDKYKQRQAILAALTLPRQPDEAEDVWLARVIKDAGEHAAKAAEEGTRIHAAVQSYYQGGKVDDAYLPHVDGVRGVLGNIAPGNNWQSEVGVACAEWGYGTKSDLHSQNWVWDLKGKDGDLDDLFGERTYDYYWMQLAATKRLLLKSGRCHSDARCGILFVSRTHPGVGHAVEITDEQLARGLEMFDALKAYWQAKNNYYPGK